MCRINAILLLVVVAVSGCTVLPAPADPKQTGKGAATVTAALAASRRVTLVAPSPTILAYPTFKPRTETPCPTRLATPPISLAPPATFTTSLMSTVIQPQVYVYGVCQYLRERWNPDNSGPGTIVVPVMFHTVFEKATYHPGDTFIPADDLRLAVETARRLGFHTVTSEQLANFLEHNARIPPRSMIWIADDRHPDIIEKYFLPIAEENQWTVTLSWIIGDTDQRKGLWKKMEELNATGYLDVQNHGYKHFYMVVGTPDETICRELYDPMPILEKHFGKKPVAFVWPGGNFTQRSAELAREAGYRIAFTAFGRGPLMFNWIPLGKPELAVDDPLMVLPRYWGRPGLDKHLEEASRIGDAAARQAFENYAAEAQYYRTVCGCALPAPRDGP